MTPVMLLIVLALAGGVLLIAEMLLPTHGVLGVLGVGLIIGALATCFYINQWFGVIMLVASVIATPFIFAAAMNLYPLTPVGRRMILQNQPEVSAAPLVHIGQTGIARTEMRPGGEVEFGDLRLEAVSESGMIPTGQSVVVTGLVDGRPRVRLALGQALSDESEQRPG